MFVALSAGFASCSNDDDEATFDAANLVGTWEATHTEGKYTDTEYPSDNEEWNEAVVEEDKYQMVFNADGTGTDDGDAFTWQLDGREITLTGVEAGDEPERYTVSLTDNELVVEFSYKDGSESGYEKVTYTRVK